MCDPIKNQKYDKQDDFWRGLIRKYEERNTQLLNEKIYLEECVTGRIPCSCPPFQEEQPRIPLPCFPSDTSVFSIFEEDIALIDRIKELSNKERELLNDINVLKIKDKLYRESEEEGYKPEVSVESRELQLMNQKLEEENRRICDDIADLKLEIRHTKETIEGPIARQLDRERRKTLFLESELEKLQQEDCTCDGVAEIEYLRSQLEKCNRNLKDMSDINNKLKDEFDLLCHKIKELQNELVQSKINEGSTLVQLTIELEKSKNHTGLCDCSSFTTTGSCYMNGDICGDVAKENVKLIIGEKPDEDQHKG